MGESGESDIKYGKGTRVPYLALQGNGIRERLCRGTQICKYVWKFFLIVEA